MPKMVHKTIPDTTLVVSEQGVESMKGSWDVEAEKPKTKPAASKK